MDFSKYNSEAAKIINKKDAHPLISSRTYRLVTYLFAFVSGSATGYFMSFLAGMSGIPSPYNYVAGGAIALGLTVSYISKEFDIAVSLASGAQKAPFFKRLGEHKFIYFVRFTTVMGTCMLLYAGIDLNDRSQQGADAAIELLTENLGEKERQKERLLERSFVTVAHKTVGKDITRIQEKIVELHLNQSADHTAFLKYLSELTSISYTLLILLFVASMGLGIDFGVSILTQKCAKLSFFSLEKFYKNGQKANGQTVQKKTENGHLPGVQIGQKIDSKNGQKVPSTYRKRTVSKKKLTRPERKKIVLDAYEKSMKNGQRFSATEIANKYRFSRSTIYDVLKSEGIKMS